MHDAKSQRVDFLEAEVWMTIASICFCFFPFLLLLSVSFATTLLVTDFYLQC